MRTLNVGDHVVFVDQRYVEHDALVTVVWGKEEFEPGSEPCINLLYVSKNTEKKDDHGRQIERESSVVHKTNQQASAFYWRFKDAK